MLKCPTHQQKIPHRSDFTPIHLNNKINFDPIMGQLEYIPSSFLSCSLICRIASISTTDRTNAVSLFTHLFNLEIDYMGERRLKDKSSRERERGREWVILNKTEYPTSKVVSRFKNLRQDKPTIAPTPSSLTRQFGDLELYCHITSFIYLMVLYPPFIDNGPIGVDILL